MENIRKTLSDSLNESIHSKLNDFEKRFEDQSSQTLVKANNFSTIAVSVTDAKICQEIQRLRELENVSMTKAAAVSMIDARIDLFERKIEWRMEDVEHKVSENKFEFEKRMTALETAETTRSLTKPFAKAADTIISPVIPPQKTEKTAEITVEYEQPLTKSSVTSNADLGWGIIIVSAACFSLGVVCVETLRSFNESADAKAKGKKSSKDLPPIASL